MSGNPSPSSSRDELLFLGTTCHHRDCNLNDFLPFSCPACKLSFCQPHFLPSQHACTAPLPASMVDRIAPQCPMCNEVVSYPPGGRQDPNAAVEQHILSGTCVAMEGGAARRKAELKAKKEAGKICFRRGCTKVLVVPMVCEACRRSFCPTHRHPSVHTCGASPSGSGSSTPVPGGAATASTGGRSGGISRLLGSGSRPAAKPAPKPAAKPTPSRPQPVGAAAAQQIEARSAAASAALKRAGQDVKDVKVPFVKTKTEKRADAELQSTIKALKARHEKGILTKAEQVRLQMLTGAA